MLRVTQSRDAASAKSYYTSPAEYYAGGKQELPGRWLGDGALRLRLSGEVEKRDFHRLCDNRDPRTGQRLTLRQKKNRTCGYDFSFHACKSASVLYGITGDPAILKAFRSAVEETARQIEAEIKTRVRKGGKSEDRTVGNAIVAEHTHLTARPVGAKIDPHLHSHCYFFNAVFDPVENRWKSGQFRDLKGSAPRYQRAFHARFAWKLAELGYPIERHGSGWEIAGLKPLIGPFSLRTRQIEDYAARHGITDAKAKDRIGARTRQHKRDDATMGQLRREWLTRLTVEERHALMAVAEHRLPEPPASRRHPPKRLDEPAWRQERLGFIRDRQQQHIYRQQAPPAAPGCTR